ncbi:MAG TPA: hypothetical protein VHL98_06520 [Microvirga sp.]|jgi:hypothetical protein|nr:hypothetical protein [Microvirga sp.]
MPAPASVSSAPGPFDRSFGSLRDAAASGPPAELVWLRRDEAAFGPSADRVRLRREAVPVRPLPARLRRRSPLLLPLGLAAAAAMAGVVALAGREEDGPAATAPAADRPQAERAAPPSWQPLPQALPLYALEAPAGIGPQAQAAREHAGGGREDTLALGGPGAPLQFRLSVTRGVAEGAGSSFYVALVRRAAEAGLPVERSAPPAPLATKFGIAEAAPATLGGLACLAVRFRHPDLAFRLHGWLCGSQRLSVEGSHLACLIDGLVLAGGREDPALTALFARAEAWRTGACALARWESASG